jgi:hypothetical protein
MNLKLMSFKKIFRRTFGLLSIAIVILAVVSLLPGTKVSSLIPILGKSEPTNSLSGRIGNDGPILVVKIDDTPPAHPQAGLEDADVVYIEQVEGGLTRLAAIFSSKIPKVIGPVRSARISDIEILQQYGRVAFAYSGAQKKLLPVIAAANLENLGAQHQSPRIYANDPLRTAPTAMMLQAQKLMTNVAEAKLPVAISKSVGWSFGDAPDTGTVISAVKVSWPANSYEATWSAQQKRWLLSHGGRLDLAASGLQLGPTTFVIQLVTITASEYYDKVGGVTPFSATVGSGKGYVLRDGHAISANWIRPTGLEGTTWSDEMGREINFAPGQVWIALTDKEPVFTPNVGAKVADATTPVSK